MAPLTVPESEFRPEDHRRRRPSGHAAEEPDDCPEPPRVLLFPLTTTTPTSPSSGKTTAPWSPYRATTKRVLPLRGEPSSTTTPSSPRPSSPVPESLLRAHPSSWSLPPSPPLPPSRSTSPVSPPRPWEERDRQHDLLGAFPTFSPPRWEPDHHHPPASPVPPASTVASTVPSTVPSAVTSTTPSSVTSRNEEIARLQRRLQTIKDRRARQRQTTRSLEEQQQPPQPPPQPPRDPAWFEPSRQSVGEWTIDFSRHPEPPEAPEEGNDPGLPPSVVTPTTTDKDISFLTLGSSASAASSLFHPRRLLCSSYKARGLFLPQGTSRRTTRESDGSHKTPSPLRPSGDPLDPVVCGGGRSHSSGSGSEGSRWRLRASSWDHGLLGGGVDDQGFPSSRSSNSRSGAQESTFGESKQQDDYVFDPYSSPARPPPATRHYGRRSNHHRPLSKSHSLDDPHYHRKTTTGRKPHHGGGAFPGMDSGEELHQHHSVGSPAKTATTTTAASGASFSSSVAAGLRCAIPGGITRPPAAGEDHLLPDSHKAWYVRPDPIDTTGDPNEARVMELVFYEKSNTPLPRASSLVGHSS